MERSYPQATITEKGERSLRGGHPWVFADEVTALEGDCPDGELVDVYSKKQRYLGTGFYNTHSKIRIRLVSRNANDRFETAFWERRVRYALDYRKTVMGDDFHCCRLIFGEADQFPGLTVDRFEDILSVQILCLGIEKRKDLILSLLVKTLRDMGETITAVFELLTQMDREKRCDYDYIILDPPAFTKSRSTVKDAIRGYKEINRKAMMLLPRGGYLATCSCFHFMTEPLFKQMLHDAAADASVSLRQIEMRHQSPDHPILWNVPETEYLKFFLFQVV